ncbi:MAG: class I SAM-dependent methyltransferase [Vicinamibacterales bacterium]
MGLLDRFAPRRPEPAPLPEPEPEPPPPPPPPEDPVFPTKALRKFLATVSERESPTLLDLAPVVGSNLNFLGDHLGCRIIVDDIYGEIEHHIKTQTLDALPALLASRFPHPDASIDGILCWDLMDYLDRAASQALADQLARLLRPEGVLLAFFGTAPLRQPHYTRYVIVDDLNLRYRSYPASQTKQASLANRDIIRLFSGLRVSDSYLLQNNLREILFKRPSYETR